MAKKYDKNNFHTHTFCVFTETPAGQISGLKPDYKSKSGSTYYFTGNGVFRLSNHWGRAANCKWRLNTSTEAKNQQFILGFALWTAFHPDNDYEKLYYIVVDFNTKTAYYQHKSNASENEENIYRTAAEASKIIKQIRGLFATENWAKHFNLEINVLRKKIITEMLATSKNLQQVKSELLEEC